MDEQQVIRHLSVVAEATRTSSIVVGSSTMSPLLPKSTDDLYGFWRQGLSALAVKDGLVVGHAAIEPLTADWFELGAVWVHPSLRGKSGAVGNKPHVGLRIYRAILDRHREKNILATTVNAAAMIIGWRTDMVPIAYADLPRRVWVATCCCPEDKTGLPRERNVPHCPLLEKICFVRITRETWERLGRPPVGKLPIEPPNDGALILRDDVAIVLAS